VSQAGELQLAYWDTYYDNNTGMIPVTVTREYEVACEPVCEPTTEVCDDDIDNDCDWAVDSDCDVEEEACTDDISSSVNVPGTTNTTSPVNAWTVAVDDVLSITAVGTWAAGSEVPCTRTSDADGIDAGHVCFELYGMNGEFAYGALVGRINGGSWFLVGTMYSAPVTEAWTLELAYRDSNYEDNSGEVTVTVTREYDIACPSTPYCGDGVVNNTGEQCDDGNEVNTDTCSNTCQTNTPAPTGGGGASSSIGGWVTSLLETGPETETLLETGPQEATPETVVSACEEDTYILARLKKLSTLDMEIVQVIPAKYARKLWTKSLKLSTKLTRVLLSASSIEARNDVIRKFVCRIEMLKEKRGLRHQNIGADSGGDEIDYLLQYLQDLAILQFVK